jgi:lipopolysaccharide export system protein LptA
MRFTIERIRLLVVVAAVLLLGALGVFLVAAKWKNRLVRRDLPQHLAKEIEQQASGFDFVHTFGAHSQYKIHASQEVQLRDNRVLLHEVRIELYADDGSRVDQIAGDTFEYDQKSGLAIAEGPVEMVLTQPSGAARPAAPTNQPPSPRQIHVKTSGVTFDRDTGMVSTMQRVDFSMMQGSGTSKGATYDSQKGYLTLDQAVELTTRRGSNVVTIRADHAEFDRSAQVCWMRGAAALYRNAHAGAAKATILFRPDGSADQLNATDGFTLATSNGGHIAAPTATMGFDDHSQPRHGHLEGGVALDSVKEDRTVHGVSPTADLDFVGQGQLRRAHMERGVLFTSDEARSTASQAGAVLHSTRTWRSPVADLDFRDAGKGQVEPATLHGTGGVVFTSETQRGNGPAAPSKMTADEISGVFGPNSTLQSITGIGHAGIEQTTTTGAKQTATGDRLSAQFALQSENAGSASSAMKNSAPNGAPPVSTAAIGEEQLQSAELDDHVVLFQQPVAKSGQAQAPVRATAGKAVYEGAGEWLHLTVNPRVENGALQLSADKVDVSQQSGDAFAHGNVKATWIGGSPGSAPSRQPTGANLSSAGMAFGGSGPAHVIANEAQINESAGEATFRGSARIWQQANSVSAPVIVLNQHTQTLVARTTDPSNPVRAVLLSAGGSLMVPGAAHPTGESGAASSARPSASSVIRVRGGDLWYSDAEHRATMRNGVLGAVVADTGSATSSSDQVDLLLMPASPNGSQAQVDRMTASGHVVLSAQDRRGAGEQLVYSSTTGDYVLTGTASAPPRLTDPERGSVTGEALIFHSHDDSVSIEGGGRETITQTIAPQVHVK